MGIKCPECDFENPDDTLYCGKCAAPLKEELSISQTKTLEMPSQGLSTGQVFAGRYQVLQELGRGGMGRVYKVMDKQINQEVALKLLKPEITSDKGMIERFRNELIISRKITHKHVCRMYDINEEKGTPYIIMEYVAGEDLKSLIKKKGKIAEDEALSIAKQVCEGLSEAHELGVVHRDLKPQNIMLDKDGKAKIMDFGIARSVEAPGVTQTGVMIGTPDYMSPEQAEGEEADQRSDIYALGVILYEMVTGQLPFKGETAMSVAIKHKIKAPSDPKKLNPGISEDLNRLILVCMEKEKSHRYQSAEELLSELTKLERGIPITEKELVKRKIEKKITRKKYLLYSGAAVLLIVLIVGGLYISRGDEEDIHSIAILPFKNLTGQTDKDFFCEGLAVEIRTDLSGVHALRVTSHRSVMTYKGSDKDIRTIGKELNVGYILDGSVLEANSSYRINVALIDPKNDEQIWAERYMGTREKIIGIQKNVSSAIVEALELDLTPEEQQRMEDQPIKNVDAYEIYLRAKRATSSVNKELLEQAEKEVKNALAITGDNELLYATLGAIYMRHNAIAVTPEDQEKNVQKAIEYANKCFEVNPNSSRGHSLMGRINKHQGNLQEAVRHGKRAIAADPNNPDDIFSLSDNYLLSGKGDAARPLIKRGLEIDPLNLNPFWYCMPGFLEVMEGRFEAAIPYYMKMSHSKPEGQRAQLFYAWMLAYNNRKIEAVTIIDHLVSLDPQSFSAQIGKFLKYALQGKRKEALQEVTPQLISVAKKVEYYARLMTDCYALIDEKEEAMNWLENDIRLGFINYPFIAKHNPFLKSIRGEERFKKILAEVKRRWEEFEI